MARRKLLVAGASGVVGFSALRHFAALPGWAVVGLSRRPPRPVEGATWRGVDLADRGACEAACGGLRDVTHLVYAALHEEPGLVAGWSSDAQIARNLAMLRNLLEPLERAASGLEHVTLLQGTKAYGAHLGPIPTPARESAPRHPHENFYWAQEDALRAAQRGKPWSWTILRPQILFGGAEGSNLNPIPALGVYAALLRAAGEPLHYPGGVSMLTEAVDADLLARACAWAATTPGCRGETFNITNGDVFRFDAVWPAIADALGMAPGERRPLQLADAMPRREREWERIVREHRLASPTSLADFVGQSFVYADLLLGYGQAIAGEMLVSTIKARRHGFHDCVDTEEMFRKWFAWFQTERLLPPR